MSAKRLVVGVTGGIGSGKSAATSIFSELGIDVVDADIVSRQVVVPGSEALLQIAEYFGSDILLEDGSLDRKALRGRIFTDAAARHWLESLLHPLIRKETERQLQESRSPYVILSSPLLLETDQHRMVDRVLLIDVPEAVQIARTSTRDETSTAAVQAIMAAQLSRPERRARADDVIDNDRDLQHLEAEVRRLHGIYLEMKHYK